MNKLYYPSVSTVASRRSLFSIGGIETIVRDLSERVAQKYELEVLVCQPQGRTAREVINGVSVTRAGSLGIWRSMPISLSYPLLMRKMASRSDLIHLHHPFPLGELSALAFDLGQKMVFTWYSAIVRQKWLARMYRPFLTRLLERVDRIILIYPGAHRHSDLLERHEHKCHVIPPGIDVRDYDLHDAVQAEVEKLRQLYGDNLVLFVGRLVYYKGLQHLIAAMPSVRGRLLIVGDGHLRERLQRQASQLGVEDRVHFLGRLSDSQLKVMFHACEVFVMPSTHSSEAFGMVQLEAMACRKPVVNTRLATGVPFVSLDRVTGLTVEPANPDALAEAINSLLDDPQLRRCYGENGRKRVLQEFTVQVMAERTMRLYEQLLQR